MAVEDVASSFSSSNTIDSMSCGPDRPWRVGTDQEPFQTHHAGECTRRSYHFHLSYQIYDSRVD